MTAMNTTALSIAMEKAPDSEQSVKLSVELSLCVQAYQLYRKIRDASGSSLELHVFKETYEDLKKALLNNIRFPSVLEMAMDSAQDKCNRIKRSASYLSLERGFVEALQNAVETAMAKYLDSPESKEFVSSLKAILQVTIDDQLGPENVAISCVDISHGAVKAGHQNRFDPQELMHDMKQKNENIKKGSQIPIPDNTSDDDFYDHGNDNLTKR